MNKFVFSILAFVILYSCNLNQKKESTIITVDPKEIRVNEIIHDSLSKTQIDLITKIQSTFAEVYPVSLEETITDFKRDLDVDREINIWLTMCNAYVSYINSKQSKLALSRKKEAFKLILSRSMMPSDEAIKNSKLSLLTEQEAQEVLSYYTDVPIPMRITTK